MKATTAIYPWQKSLNKAKDTLRKSPVMIDVERLFPNKTSIFLSFLIEYKAIKYKNSVKKIYYRLLLLNYKNVHFGKLSLRFPNWISFGISTSFSFRVLILVSMSLSFHIINEWIFFFGFNKIDGFLLWNLFRK